MNETHTTHASAFGSNNEIGDLAVGGNVAGRDIVYHLGLSAESLNPDQLRLEGVAALAQTHADAALHPQRRTALQLTAEQLELLIVLLRTAQGKQTLIAATQALAREIALIKQEADIDRRNKNREPDTNANA